MTDLPERRRRVLALLGAAERLRDSSDPLGIQARLELPASTGLSRANVAIGLERCLETDADDPSLERLCRSAPTALRAHVVLPSNVFTAPLRAIAVALASSPHVLVRPSRREPVLVRLLAQAAPASFRVVAALAPEPGDHVWAFGTGTTLDEIGSSVGPEIVLHANGPGFGVAVWDPTVLDAGAAARRIVDDVVPFDQRGCLSPLVVLVVGRQEAATGLAERLARELAEREGEVPVGHITEAEAAERTRWRDTLRYAGSVMAAGSGFVGRLDHGAWRLPPPGRNVLVVAVTDTQRILERAGDVVAVGAAVSAPREAELRALLPGVRWSALGAMQTPPLDGPVDLRPRVR